MRRRKMSTDEWSAELALLMVELQRRSGTTETYPGIKPRDEHGNVIEVKREKAA